MIKLGVLLSGSGTNLQAIIDAIEKGLLDARIELVVSSRPDAFGLKRAEAAGIPTLALTREDYRDPLAADARIALALQNAGDYPDTQRAVADFSSSGTSELTEAKGERAGVDYVVMAGYMRMVREPLLSAFPNRIINLHPALLPSFVGAHAIADAFAYGVKVTGITIHFANEDYDKGPIIAQQSVLVEPEDTLESLEQRIHAVEHTLYPQVLQLFAEGRVVIGSDGKVQVH